MRLRTMREGEVRGVEPSFINRTFEVKAGMNVGRSDFKHLEWFRGNLAAGKRFRGIVLYAGEHTLPFGKDMLAVPISALWS